MDLYIGVRYPNGTCTLEIIQNAYLLLGLPLHSCSLNPSIIALQAPEHIGMTQVLVRLYVGSTMIQLHEARV